MHDQTICFNFSTGAEEEEEEDATQRLVLGLGTPVLETVVEECKALELLVIKELVGLVIFLLHEDVTLIAVLSIVNGLRGVTGVHVRLTVDKECRFEQEVIQVELVAVDLPVQDHLLKPNPATQVAVLLVANGLHGAVGVCARLVAELGLKKKGEVIQQALVAVDLLVQGLFLNLDLAT